MALTPNSAYHSYPTMNDFPTTGEVDTFYLNRASCTNDDNPPTSGNIYLWDGGGYVFHCSLQDSSFGGTRPNHPPVNH